MGALGWTAVAVVSLVAITASAELALRILRPKLRPLTEWENWEVHHKVAAIDELAAAGGASVVAIGSSTMNAGVNPDSLSNQLHLGRPAFNAALNGAAVRLLELWTLRIVVPRLRPEVVVIGLGTGELNGNNLVGRRLLEAMVRSPAWRRLEGGGSIQARAAGLLSRSLLVRYRKLLGRRALFQPDPFERATTCRRLGLLRFFLLFRYREYRITDEQLKIWNDALSDYAIGNDDIASLHRLVLGLRAAGVTPMIVRTPFAPDWIGLHPHGAADVERFDSVLSTVSSMDGVTFVDLGPHFTSLDEYADPVHMNGVGQERFSHLLAAAISDLPAAAAATKDGS